MGFANKEQMGSEELGVHNHSTGDLPNALKAFNRMRDYCTTPLHIATTAFRTIAVNIEQKNWLGVQAQVTKIRGLQMKPEETAKTQPKTVLCDSSLAVYTFRLRDRKGSCR